MSNTTYNFYEELMKGKTPDEIAKEFTANLNAAQKRIEEEKAAAETAKKKNDTIVSAREKLLAAAVEYYRALGLDTDINSEVIASLEKSLAVAESMLHILDDNKSEDGFHLKYSKVNDEPAKVTVNRKPLVSTIQSDDKIIQDFIKTLNLF